MRRLLLFLLFVLPTFCHAQADRQTIRLITWFGPGSLTLPTSPDWHPDTLNVYDKGTRPVFQFHNKKTDVVASFILFENLSGIPTARGCRDDAIHPILEQQKALISNRVDGFAEDGKYATSSYFTKLTETARNHDVYYFAGDEKVCAELHVSAVAGRPDEDARLKAAAAEFHPDLTYQPAAPDFYLMGSLLYKSAPMLAAPYYKEAVDRMPPDEASLRTPRRVATDNLVMALGMSGDFKASRVVAEHAIVSDPDYPLNYYNLACADAEEGHVSAARAHLEQAFARKQNVLAGERLPDPAQDSSILKLKQQKAFWSFVESLTTARP